MDSFTLSLVERATSPHPALPTEVVEEVIDQASDDPQSLRQFSLSCKPLLTCSRFHLFKSILIRSVEQLESSREFLDARPWVRLLVRKVILMSDRGHSYPRPVPNIPLLDIVRLHLLTQLPNLRAWRMEVGVCAFTARLSLHRTALLCYRTYGGRIRKLELSAIPMEDVSHFTRLVSAFTNIQELFCSGIKIRKKDTASLHPSEVLNFKLAKLPKIQHLSVNMPTFLMAQCIQKTDNTDLSRLQFLQISA